MWSERTNNIWRFLICFSVAIAVAARYKYESMNLLLVIAVPYCGWTNYHKLKTI